MDFKLGKVILTINTAHPFFTKLYEPLSQYSNPGTHDKDDDGAAEGTTAGGGELLTALHMVLFSLARAQSQMLDSASASEHNAIFETLRREWSANLKTQLETA